MYTSPIRMPRTYQFNNIRYLRKCRYSVNSRRFDFVEIAKISMCLQRHSKYSADAKEIRQKVHYVKEQLLNEKFLRNGNGECNNIIENKSRKVN